MVEIKRHGSVWTDSEGQVFVWCGQFFQNMVTGEMFDKIVERISEDHLKVEF